MKVNFNTYKAPNFKGTLEIVTNGNSQLFPTDNIARLIFDDSRNKLTVKEKVGNSPSFYADKDIAQKIQEAYQYALLSPKNRGKVNILIEYEKYFYG